MTKDEGWKDRLIRQAEQKDANGQHVRAQAIRWLVEGRSGTTGEDDAYDGQRRPQERELTARERDVLCGLIGDVLGAWRRDGTMPRGGADWIDHLAIVQLVISARED